MTDSVSLDSHSIRRLAFGVGLFMLACPAVAQDRSNPDISSEIVVGQSLSGQDRQVIADYVAHRVGLLSSLSSRDIATAQNDLISKISRAPSPAFAEAYSNAVGAALVPLIKHEKLQTRLAATVIAASLFTSAAFEVHLQGLQDDNAGVRYQAAKGIADILGGRSPEAPAQFTAQQQNALLGALQSAMANEPSTYVFGEMGRALSALTLAEAYAASVTMLTQRVAQYRLTPGATLLPVRDMFDSLLLNLNRRQADGENIDGPLRELVAIAGLYLGVVRERLVEHFKEEIEPSTVALIDSAEKILDKAIGRFAADLTRPQMARAASRPGKLGDLVTEIDKWVGPGEQAGLLSTSAINIPHENLKLPPLQKRAEN